MKSKKQIDIKVYILPFVITTLIFFVITNVVINGIKNYHYNHTKEDSLTIAKNYSHSLAKAAEATDVVNELLEEKMLVASRTTALYDGNYSSELLAELANTLEVDEIDYYNTEGEVVYSNLNQIIGWKAFKGHPVHDFMLSDSKSLIGDIRQDSVTGNYYKYGYFKVSDGFIQIGVKADKVHNFLGSFEMQQLLNEIQEAGGSDQVCFIDNTFNIIGSSDHQCIGQEITDQGVKNAVLEGREYIQIYGSGGQKEYQVFVPVYSEGNIIGTLAIAKSLASTEAVVRQISIISLVALLIIYLSLLYIMIFTYKKNKALIQLAYYDTLTGLPNNQYLTEFINEEIAKTKENKKAFLLIKCNNFKVVNLIFGYEYGDDILKELSEKMQELLDNNKKLFRLTANRFGLYVKNYSDQKDLISIANRISEVLTKPIKVKDSEQYLYAQVGIVEINSKYNNFDQILKDASISLSNIKKNASENYAFFNKLMESSLQRVELIEKELRAAISANNTNKLYLEFQPQVDLRTNKIVCFEALARMKIDSLGYIPPLEFIAVAERKQLIVPLGKLILKKACEFISTLINEGYSDIKVAVNVSVLQLMRDDFTETVLDIIKRTNIDKSNLELEITESVLLDNFEIINAKLKTLKEHKIGIALDDFGTGYSSFSRLGELNIDTVKIDKYFISKISAAEQKKLIIGDIISMVHKLGLTVIAEGVEVELEKDYLIKNSCDIMQGYLFCKPIPGEDAIELLKTNYNTK